MHLRFQSRLYEVQQPVGADGGCSDEGNLDRHDPDYDANDAGKLTDGNWIGGHGHAVNELNAITYFCLHFCSVAVMILVFVCLILSWSSNLSIFLVKYP